MSEQFTIGGNGINAEIIMAEIQKRVAEKEKAGAYQRYNLNQLAAGDINQLRAESDFLKYYLELIQHTADIDIGDFQIPSKGGILGKPLAKLKRLVWIILRFYTYRLFAQQKEFNFQLVNTVTSLNKRIDELEAKPENRTENGK
jgi:hypothetical protein